MGGLPVETLLHSEDEDLRLEGIERLSGRNDAESAGRLASEIQSLLGQPGGPRRAAGDARALLLLVQGLARDHRPGSLGALTAVLRGAAAGGGGTAPSEADTLVSMAVAEAAMALAKSQSPAAMQTLHKDLEGGAGQQAAFRALLAYPSPSVPASASSSSAAAVLLAGARGDLRTLAALRQLVPSDDVATQTEALVALSALGDARSEVTAREWTRDHEPRRRIAAADALIHLGSADGAGAVADLVSDQATQGAGLELAQHVDDARVTKAAAACALATADPSVRQHAIAALGAQTSAAAVEALRLLADDTQMAVPAADALAHSPSPEALGAIEALALREPTRRLAARAYLARRTLLGAHSAVLDAMTRQLARSLDVRDRSVAAQARVAFGEVALDEAFADSDPSVRRGAALGALAHLDEETGATLVARLRTEVDALTRSVLAAGLLVYPDRAGAVSSTELRSWLAEGRPEGVFGAVELGRRAADDSERSVVSLLGAGDPVVRAQALRGYASSGADAVISRAARLCRFDSDRTVRRVAVDALAMQPSTSPARITVLEAAANLDPDPEVRGAAARALAGRTVERATARGVAWISLIAARGAPPPPSIVGVLVVTDGTVRPVAFDGEGQAVVAGLPEGSVTLRLASRLATYSPDVHGWTDIGSR